MSESESKTDWDRLKEFWQTPGRVDTYDLVHQGGYSQYNEMEKQEPGDVMAAGEWVRAEDYRAAVEALEAKLSAALAFADSLKRAVVRGALHVQPIGEP